MQITKELIERYHAGQCSQEEQEQVEHWLESDDLELSFPGKLDLNAVKAKGWQKLVRRYNFVKTERQASFGLQSTIKPIYRLSWQIAACMVLVLGAAIFYYLGRNTSNQAVAQVFKEVRTLKGQKMKVTLSDGTVVQLNSESVLRFPQIFTATARQVQFEGEAFFKVAKNASKPFTIYTANTEVGVLGTRFNLRAYPSEHYNAVVVEEGRVRFSGKNKTDSLMLTANQQGIFTDQSVMQKKEVVVTKYLAWKDNQLVFDDAPLKEIAETLQRWYGVEVVIKKAALMDQRYTGRFDQPHLKTVLESMAFAIKFKYHQENKAYVIY